MKEARFCIACGAPTERMRGRCARCHIVIYRLQLAAQRAVMEAKRLGVLPQQRHCRCADCGGQASEYDHRDYFRPLDVAPVCRGCNARRGAAIQLRPGSMEHIDLRALEAA